eukprot:COSAG06_NODE_1561_length_9104_cov_25.044309_1_plen_188_part_00
MPTTAAPATATDGRVVLDIAGGKGHLSEELRACGLSPVLVDPCAISGRSSTMLAGEFAEAVPELEPDLKPEPEPEPELVPNPEPSVRCMTLQELVTTEPQLIASCAALVGLHPDEATEHIVDLALARSKPFAVVPCCVMPHLFPPRNLTSSGALVVGVRIPQLCTRRRPAHCLWSLSNVGPLTENRS